MFDYRLAMLDLEKKVPHVDFHDLCLLGSVPSTQKYPHIRIYNVYVSSTI